MRFLASGSGPCKVILVGVTFALNTMVRLLRALSCLQVGYLVKTSDATYRYEVLSKSISNFLLVFFKIVPDIVGVECGSVDLDARKG